MENDIKYKFTLGHLIYAFIIGFSLAYVLLSIPSVMKNTGTFKRLLENELENNVNEDKECKVRMECIVS